jgi:hypothetical protein
MKKSAPNINRREQLLHEACKQIAEWRAAGVPIGRAIASAARKFKGRSQGGGKYLKLSSKSLRRHWDRFNKQRDPSVFRLNYKVGMRAKFDPALLCLVTLVREKRQFLKDHTALQKRFCIEQTQYRNRLLRELDALQNKLHEAGDRAVNQCKRLERKFRRQQIDRA